MKHAVHELKVRTTAFKDRGWIPRRYTVKGENFSPEIMLEGVSPHAQSIAVVMEDLDIPLIASYTHWLIWNIPVQNTIPENIPHGSIVGSLGNAVQGIGYGKHGYKGPNPPPFIKKPHRYQFHIYILDCRLPLESNAGKKQFIKAIEGHVLQHGSLQGLFQNK